MGQNLSILDDGSLVHALSPSTKVSIAITALAGGVANCAALTALSLTTPHTISDGAHVWVESVRDYFVLRTSSATPAVNSILASTVAGRLWFRCHICDPTWDVQATWFIDSSAGNDENVGDVIGSPIKTWTEMLRRVGFKRIVKNPLQLVITIMSGLPTTDPMIGDWLVANGARVNVNGTPVEVFNGTVSAKQDLNTATNAENQATSTWAVATHLNRLVWDQTANRFAWIAKDLGSNNARLSPWATVNETNGGISVTTGNTAVSNVVRAYTLPTIACFQFEVSGTAGASTPCLFNKLDFNGSGGTMRFMAKNAQPQFQNCRFSGAIRFGAGTNIFNNCWFGADGSYAIDYSAYLRLNAGLCTVSWGGTGRPQCFYELRSNVLMQGTSVLLNHGTICRIDAAYFMEVTVGNVLNVSLGSFLELNGTLNGKDNTGVSIAFQQCTGGQYLTTQAFGIVSAGGDITCGGSTTALAIDPATGQPNATPRTTSFANLLASYASGGFGGIINDPLTGTRLGKAA